MRNAADRVDGFNTPSLIILHPRQEAADAGSLRGLETHRNTY